MRVDFLANASHELRTPLASLSGYIETLRGHARDDTAARERFLGVMAAQAERMSRLIADLMSLSRIELNEHISPSGGLDVSAAAARDVADGLRLAPIVAAAGVSIEVIGGADAHGRRPRPSGWQVALNPGSRTPSNTPPRGTAVKVQVTIGPSPAPQDPGGHSIARCSIRTPWLAAAGPACGG